MSPPGSKNGPTAPTQSVAAVTSSNSVGFCSSAALTNCARKAPMRPEAARRPMADARWSVGKLSAERTSRTHHAALEAAELRCSVVLPFAPSARSWKVFLR